jgi:hypothetical protein
MRAEKKARAEGAGEVQIAHLESFISNEQPHDTASGGAHWHAAALARLMRVPAGFMRDASVKRVEDYARAKGIAEISLPVVEEGLAAARKAMEEMMTAGNPPSPETDPVESHGACPFAKLGEVDAIDPRALSWTAGAAALLDNVPEGFCREMARKAVNTIAAQSGGNRITETLFEQVMDTFEAGAAAATQTMDWDAGAMARIERAPETVRGMLIKEVEAWAQRHGIDKVGDEAVEAVKAEWQERGVFHLDPNDPRGSK